MRLGWLDQWPTWARDLTLMVVASLLSWVSSDLVPALHSKGGAAALAAPVVVLIVNALTPITRAYTITGDADDEGE
jgi:uncharacterized membrane protein YvlD (DUF360 family)